MILSPTQRVSKDGGYELLLRVENAVAPAPFNSSMLSHHLRRQMPLTERATVVGITRLSTSEDGDVIKACDTNGDGRVGAVVVDVGTDQHQALQHAERKVRTYGKALVGLASLLCLSVCGNLASSALTILVFKESRTRGAIQPVVLSDSKAAATVGTGLTAYGTGPTGMIVPPSEVPTYVKETLEPGVAWVADVVWDVDHDDSGVMPFDPEPPVVAAAPADDRFPHRDVFTGWLQAHVWLKKCAVAPSGTEACWEIADPAMTDIPDGFLDGSFTDLAGTLKVGAAIRTIGASAFANTRLAGLDLSEATSLVSIGDSAFFNTNLEGTLVIPAKVTTISNSAFSNTKLTSLDLSNAAALVEIEVAAFHGTGLKGRIVVPFEVPTYVKDTLEDDTFPPGVVIVSVRPPGVKRCAITPSGEVFEACWELADPAMTDIPDYFLEGTWYLEGKNDLTGTLKVGPAVKTIGAFAFAKTKLTGLDLSKATSLVWIGNRAFLGSTDLAGTLKVGPAVKTIGAFAFANTKLAGLDLSKATSLVEIGENAFSEAKLEGTLAVPDTVTRIGASAFAYTTFAGLDLSKATSLVEIGESAFSDTKLAGTLAVPNTVTTIGNNAFSNTKLTGLDLSKATSLVSIEERAFSDTYVEGTLAVPNTVKTIGSYAFYNTKLTYLDLSDANSLLSFGDSAFPRHVGYL